MQQAWGLDGARRCGWREDDEKERWVMSPALPPGRWNTSPAEKRPRRRHIYIVHIADRFLLLSRFSSSPGR